MPLQWVIEEDNIVGWRHAGPTQVIGVTAEEAKIAVAIDQAEAMRKIAEGLMEVAAAIRETAST